MGTSKKTRGEDGIRFRYAGTKKKQTKKNRDSNPYRRAVENDGTVMNKAVLMYKDRLEGPPLDVQ